MNIYISPNSSVRKYERTYAKEQELLKEQYIAGEDKLRNNNQSEKDPGLLESSIKSLHFKKKKKNFLKNAEVLSTSLRDS